MPALSYSFGIKMWAAELSQNERFLWPMAVFAGILMCKIVYDVTGWISSSYVKGYNKLSKAVKVEWNNRGFSTFHALLVASASFYLLLFSDVFQNDSYAEQMIDGKSTLSDTTLGVSIGYFLLDLGMILWNFPALGGKEYVLHHCLSIYSIILSIMSGQAQIYILLVLFSEITTPFVNLRWYLDVAGQKNSKLYVYNGIALFLGWLVARVLLFIFFFIHMYVHFDQVLSVWKLDQLTNINFMQGIHLFLDGFFLLIFTFMGLSILKIVSLPHQLAHDIPSKEVKRVFPLGFYSLFVAPPLLAVMNLFWFWKIIKGLMKTLSKARHRH